MLSLEDIQKHKQFSITVFLYIPFIIGILFIMIFFPKNGVQNKLPGNATSPTSTQSIAYAEMSYDDVESKLLTTVQEKTPRFALEELKLAIAENPDIANNCHGLVHSIGRAALEKYKVFDAALVFEDNTCGSGYIHGVVEGRLAKAKDVFSELQSLCQDNSGNCYHGVGHGLMLYTSNNVPTALSYCDAIKHDQGRLFCSEGVFMENFNTDTTLHPSDYLKKDDPFYPCNDQKDLYKGTCYFYAPDFYLNIYPAKYEEALAWCATAEKGYELICLNGLGSRIMKRNITQPKTVENVCMKLSTDKRSYCIDGMTSYYLVHHYSLGKAKDMCESLQGSNQEACYHAVNVRSALFPQ